MANVYYADETGVKYTNKFDAIDSGKKISFHYHDHVWDSIDWTKEPEEHITDLYIQNLKRIRSENDYIVLMYSGGIDSTMILDLCVQNKIHLDDIVIVATLKADKYPGDPSNRNEEIYTNALPTLKKHGITNYRILDYTDRVLNGDHPYFNDPSQLRRIGCRISPTNWYWNTLHKDLFGDKLNGKFKMISGQDKPVIRFTEFEKSFTFPDSTVLELGAAITDDYELQDHREYFFWSPKFPKIVHKQISILSRFYDTVVNSRVQKDHPKVSFEHFYTNLDSIIRQLMYPDIKSSVPLVAPKSQSTVFSLRDAFFFEAKNEHTIKFLLNVIPYVTHKYESPIHTKRFIVP